MIRTMNAIEESVVPIDITDTHWCDIATVRLRARIRAEYREMPGLSITAPQAARLWGLDARRSQHLLTSLVAEGFLVRDARGRYGRRSSSR
jgi:hypothetical protein